MKTDTECHETLITDKADKKMLTEREKPLINYAMCIKKTKSMGPTGPICFKVHFLGTITTFYSSFPRQQNIWKKKKN